jgi:hypothetical protein
MIFGHVLGQTLDAHAQDEAALRLAIAEKIVVGFFGQKKYRPGLPPGHT